MCYRKKIDLKKVVKDRKNKFDNALNIAKKYMLKANYEIAALYLQISANYASNAHAGFFYSKEIEDILNDISFDLKLNKKDNFNNKEFKKVLHIATQIYDVGGHTRLIQNWVDYDSKRINDLVITDQFEYVLPSRLKRYFEERATKVFYLKDESTSILRRVKILSDLSKNYDILVLHIHPYDVIPVIAFAHDNMPVLFLNHADHRFWIGKCISNIVLEIRNSGKKLSAQKRLINEKHQILLPIPLKKTNDMTKYEARKLLSISDRDFLVFSVASSYKYRPLVDGGIKNILLPLIEKFENLKVIVVGPNENETYWRRLNNSSKGRIKAIGVKPQIDYYYIAADLYLDSYPISSLTSLLDAAKYGVPIFSLEKQGDTLDIDDVALDNLEYKTKNFEELCEKITCYIKEPEKLKAFGDKCFKEINSYHINEGWLSLLNNVYAIVHNIDKIKNVNDNTEFNEHDETNLIYIHYKNKSRDYEFISSFLVSYNLLPWLERLKLIIGSLRLRKDIVFLLVKLIIPNKLKNMIKYFKGVEKN
jgi:hypothetical protein